MYMISSSKLLRAYAALVKKLPIAVTPDEDYLKIQNVGNKSLFIILSISAYFRPIDTWQ